MSKYRIPDIERLATVFKALSNQQRLRIFFKLVSCCPPGGRCDVSAEGMRRCVGDLGGDLGLAASTVSHHVKELRRASLIQVERRGQRMECWINEGTLRLVASVLAGGAQDVTSQQRRKAQ